VVLVVLSQSVYGRHEILILGLIHQLVARKRSNLHFIVSSSSQDLTFPSCHIVLLLQGGCDGVFLRWLLYEV